MYLDTTIKQISNRLNAIKYRPGEPVQLRHHQGISGSEPSQQLLKLRSIHPPAGIGFLDHFLAAMLQQQRKLLLEAVSISSLGSRRYPCIAKNHAVFHLTYDTKF